MPTLAVRHTRPEDIPALIDLQRRVYPDIPAWNAERFLGQIETFPQGQVVATLDGRPVGCASSLIVVWDDWASEHSWKEITASGTFDTHDATGTTLYGAEVFVEPRSRGHRVGHALYDARRKVCRALNLKRIIACGRLPGYHRHAHEMPPELYCRKVLWGDIRDPVLGFQLREGFDFCGVIEDYIPEDFESHGFASLIVWLNPSWDARKPTRLPTGPVL